MNSTTPQLHRARSFARLQHAVRPSGPRPLQFRHRVSVSGQRIALALRGYDDFPGTERNTSLTELALRPHLEVRSLHR